MLITSNDINWITRRFPCAISAPSHRRALNNCQFTRIAMRSWIQCIQSKKKHAIGDRGEAELMSLKFESYIVYDVMRSECIRARSVSFANLFFFTFLFCCLLFHLSMWDTYEQHCKPIPELRATAMSWPKKVLHHLRNYNYRLNEVIQLCLYVGDFADYSTWKKKHSNAIWDSTKKIDQSPVSSRLKIEI